MNSQDGSESQLFSSPTEAEGCAVDWLRTLRSRSSYEWSWEHPASLSCELVPDVPAQVVGSASPTGSHWAPALWFTVGVKYEGRYWQGQIGRSDDSTVLSDEALAAFETVLEVLQVAAQTSYPAPAAVAV